MCFAEKDIKELRAEPAARSNSLCGVLWHKSLSRNDATQTVSPKAESNRETDKLSQDIATEGWDHSFFLFFFFNVTGCAFCSLSQCVKAGITHAGTLSVCQTSVLLLEKGPGNLPDWRCEPTPSEVSRGTLSLWGLQFQPFAGRLTVLEEDVSLFLECFWRRSTLIETSGFFFSTESLMETADGRNCWWLQTQGAHKLKKRCWYQSNSV